MEINYNTSLSKSIKINAAEIVASSTKSMLVAVSNILGFDVVAKLVELLVIMGANSLKLVYVRTTEEKVKVVYVNIKSCIKFLSDFYPTNFFQCKLTTQLAKVHTRSLKTLI